MNKAIILGKKIVSLKPRQTHRQTIFQVLKGSKNHTIQSAGCHFNSSRIAYKLSAWLLRFSFLH